MRRWLMLLLGTAAQASACVFAYGIPYLAPELRGAADLSLAQVGLVVACPTAGLVLALVAWGAAADRYGERTVISLGLGLAAAALACALPLDGTGHGTAALGAVFAVAGAASASVYAASGRLVLGWFAAHERGFAMGLRQTATPLGMGLAALVVPPLAERWGVTGATAFFAAVCGLNALVVAVLVTDPPRPGDAPPDPPSAAPAQPPPGRRPRGHRRRHGPRRHGREPGGQRSGGRPSGSRAPGGQAAEDQAAGGPEERRPRSSNPYRSPALWRIHSASTLLVVPQFTVAAFGLVFLVDVRHWDAVHAGQLLAGAQVLAALGRIAAGRWSDAVGSRLRPMRRLAIAIAAVVALAAWGAAWPAPASDAALVLACAITASTNGLAYTATAELAGPAWTGRALGVQNTGQNLTAAAVPPLIGALITATGYTEAFAVAAAFAAGAALVVPVRGGTAAAEEVTATAGEAAAAEGRAGAAGGAGLPRERETAPGLPGGRRTAAGVPRAQDSAPES